MTEESKPPAWVRRSGLLAGVAAFAAVAALPWEAPPEARAAAAMTALMVLWWMTEAIPIHWTALAPLLLTPATGCLLPRALGRETFLLGWIFGLLDLRSGPAYQGLRALGGYLDANTFLFLGGMAIAAAMQRWNLHRRVALRVLAAIGGGPRRVVFGFLVATAFISLWISNTATAVMMVPIGLAVIRQVEGTGPRLRHFGLAIMLAVAYAANVGGIGTKIGTAPNVIFCGAAAGMGHPVGFLDYLPMGLPFVVLFLPLVWLVLGRIAARDSLPPTAAAEAVRRELAALGPASREEKFVLAAFLCAAGLWIAGKPLSEALGITGTQMDAATAMVVMLALMTVPVRAGRPVLDAAALRGVPWSVLLLLGGSFALADAVGDSGLDDYAGARLAGLGAWGPLPALLAVAALTIATSAVASNTATTSVMMSLLRTVFAGPLALPAMGTAAIAASCDFMLPAGTPPNAIVFGSGYVELPRMVRVGFVLDVAAALLAGGWGYVGLRWLLA